VFPHTSHHFNISIPAAAAVAAAALCEQSSPTFQADTGNITQHWNIYENQETQRCNAEITQRIFK
jgi:hypothetical protein